MSEALSGRIVSSSSANSAHCVDIVFRSVIPMHKNTSAARTKNHSPLARLSELAFTLVLLCLINGACALIASASENNAPSHLRCEAMQEPIGIDVTHPRLSWQLRDFRRGAKQTAYEIRVASSPEALAHDRADVWDSGRIDSDQSRRTPMPVGSARGDRPFRPTMIIT